MLDCVLKIQVDNDWNMIQIKLEGVGFLSIFSNFFVVLKDS